MYASSDVTVTLLRGLGFVLLTLSDIFLYDDLGYTQFSNSNPAINSSFMKLPMYSSCMVFV